MTLTFNKVDCDGRTVFYAGGEEGDAIPFIEIRANVTDSGGDTLAFVKATAPEAETMARHIVRCLSMHEGLLEALHYLLEQTVDMDLKYGIGLSEGEEDARQQALALFAKARE